MSLSNRTERLRRPWRSVLLHAGLAALAIAGQLLSMGMAAAHQSHDHLNPPVAPHITAVTPDYELVGVLSGAQRSMMSKDG